MSDRVHQQGEPGFITPGSQEHSRSITASKVASILGVSRWQSAFSLWHEMQGGLQPEPEKDIFNVGHAMECALAELWRIEHPGWRVSKGEVQFFSDRWTFPALATIDRRASRGRSRHILEMKCARDLEEWGDPTMSGEIPADYCAQVIFQMMVSDMRDPADVLVMGPFFKHRTYHVEYDQDIADWIIAECTKFWDSLLTGVEPDLDDSVSTYTAVKELHPDIDGSQVEVPPDLIVQIRELTAEIGPLEAKRRGLKTELLALMGNAQKAVVAGEPVARRQRGRGDSVNLVML